MSNNVIDGFKGGIIFAIWAAALIFLWFPYTAGEVAARWVKEFNSGYAAKMNDGGAK